MPTKGGRTTWRDVAERAGVSPTTVSLVLGARGDELGISAATQERVRRAAREVGYFPNRLTRSIRAGRTGILGLFVNHVALGERSAWLRETLLALHMATNERGQELLLMSDHPVRTTDEVLGQLFGGMLDGVLVMVREGDPFVPEFVRGPVPAVAIGDPQPGLPSLAVDYAAATERLVDHLVERGHRRLAYFEPEFDIPSKRERLRGFRAALARHGLEPGAFEIGTWHDAPRALRGLLARDPRPTALLCFNDDWANAVLRAAREAGVGVPGDLAVAGFDGLSLDHSPLPLTTIRYPVEALAHAAVERLLAMIESRDPGPLPHLPAPLAVGETT